ncbi:MAG: nucleotide pyrophosphohydrolase [Candidatus Lokiarchaeota archaeon]|nr:nucleotide pyrophosphohydrolase [Candidatus Lokiarchaeota archaeon]
MSKDVSLREFQKKIDEWIALHGGYWTPLSMLSAIVEEIGEVAKEINHLEGFKPKKSDKVISNLGEEIADVLFALICLANSYKIDISYELEAVIEKYAVRDSKRFK